MVVTAEGIWNQGSTSQTTIARSMDSTTGTSSSSTNASSISANDFLQLLVTEMQNQDPTAATDPNEYINQLVQVNSLEQLVSINQTLTADSAVPAKSSSERAHSDVPSAAVVSDALTPGKVQQSLEGSSAIHPSVSNHSSHSLLDQAVSGNLTIPAENPAATRVGRSLANY